MSQTPLTSLPNIGEHGARQLERVGIDSAEKLVAVGAEAAWCALQIIDPGVCVHQLYALEGAVSGIPKTLLSSDRKSQLKKFAADHRCTPADDVR